MRRTPESSPDAEPQPREEQYKKDTAIVVNIDGEWKAARVKADAILDKNGDLQLTARIGRKDHIKTYEKGENPEIIHGAELTATDIEDPTAGGSFDVSNTKVSPEGFVEYTVKTPEGKILNNVPQELLLSWKKTLELETKVRDELETRIATVRDTKRAELEQTRRELEKSLGEVYQHLPRVGNMQEADRTSIKDIQKKVEDLHVQAEREIDAFEKVVAAYEIVDPGRKGRSREEQMEDKETPFDPRAEYATNKAYNFENESAADRTRREKVEKKAHDETREQARKFRIEIQDALRRAEQKVEKEKQEELDRLIESKVRAAETKFNADKTTQEAYEARIAALARNARRPPRPFKYRKELEGVFDEDAEREKLTPKIKLRPAENARFAKQVEDDKKQVYADLFTRLSSATGYHSEVYSEMNDRRLKAASESVIDVVTSGTVTDFDDAGANDSVRFQKNVEILDQILDEGQKEYVPEDLDIDPEGKEIFDWDAERSALLKRTEALKEMMEEDGKAPDGTFELKQYEELNALIEKMEKDYDMLESLDTVTKTALGRTKSSDIEKLNKARLKQLREHLDGIKTIETALQTFESTRRKEEEQADILAHQKKVDDAAESHEFTREGIDIPDNELRDMILSKAGGVRSAIELMMRGGGVKKKTNGSFEISQDLINQIRGMFTDQPPSVDDAKLRSFGIKNWDKFKTLWDTELSQKAVVILNTMLTQTLERRIAENTSAWDKMKAHKASILGRVATNGALLGIGSLGLGGLMSMAAESEGAQTALRSLTPDVEGAQAGLRDATRLAGGAAAGGAKWWSFKKYFGKDSAKQKMAGREETLHEQKREELISSVLGDMFKDDGSGGYEANREDAHGDYIDGNLFDGFTRMLSHTIRETSAGEQSFTLEDGHTFKLSGSDLMAYQRHLKSIETRNPDEKMQTQLAWAIAKMKSNGAEMSKPGDDPSMWDKPSFTDKMMANMQGQETKAGAVVANVAIAGLMMTDPNTRMIFGAALMGRMGVGFGEQMFYKSERKGAVQRVEKTMAHVHHHIEEARTFGFHNTSEKKQEDMRRRVIELKRVIHGTAPPEDMAAVIYKVKRKGKDDDGIPLDPTVQVDGMKFAEIQSLVYEAERENIYLEEEKHKAKLEQVLVAMQKTSADVAKPQEENKKWTRRLKKAGYKTLGGLAGAIGGAAIGFVTPSIVRGLADSVDYYAEGVGITDADGALYGGPARFGTPIEASIEDLDPTTRVVGTPPGEGVAKDVPNPARTEGQAAPLPDSTPGDTPVSPAEGSGGAALEETVTSVTPERHIHGVHETVTIAKGDNPWRIIKAELNESFKDDPAYQSLTDSGKNYLVDGIKDQYTSNPSAYRSSFMPGGEFRMGKLMEDYGGLDKVVDKMSSVDPSDTNNHELLRQLAQTKAQIAANLEAPPALTEEEVRGEVIRNKQFVEEMNDAIARNKGLEPIIKDPHNILERFELGQLSAENDVASVFNDSGFSVHDIKHVSVAAASEGDPKMYAELTMSNGDTIVVDPKITNEGWQMGDLYHESVPAPVEVDMAAVQAELDAAVANKVSVPETIVYGDSTAPAEAVETVADETAAALPAESATTEAGNTNNVIDLAEARAARAEAAEPAPNYDFDLDPGVPTVENPELADVYRDQLRKITEIFLDGDVAVADDNANNIKKGFIESMDVEFAQARSGIIPEELQQTLVDNPDAAQKYIMDHLPQEERLLFAGETGGFVETALGENSIELAESPGFALRLTDPEGGQKVFKALDGWYFVDNNGQLGLHSKSLNITVPAELDTQNGAQIVPKDGGTIARLPKAA